jgi:feruloyl esterase
MNTIIAASLACLQLKGVQIPAPSIGLPTGGAVVTSAALIAPSTSLPEYCKVEGSIKPRDSHAPAIKFELDLPSAWNQKLLMLGGGGYDGIIPNTSGEHPRWTLRLAGALGARVCRRRQ